MEKKKVCSIGGQAVLEGVMMRGKGSMATAVRNPQGEVVVESSRFEPLEKKSKIFKVPVIRGVAAFVSSMALGIKTLNRSSEVFSGLEEEEPSKFEKWLAKKFNVDIMSVLIGISLIIGIALAIGLFVVIPHLITEGIIRLFNFQPNTITLNLIAGLVRIIIFLGYIILVGKIKDIKRLFRYHGAEHKVINCYEHQQELKVENIQKMTTVNDRCGTTFLFIIMVFSILFFSLDVFSNNWWQRILIRIAFIPVVAGISYEILKMFAKYDNKFVRIMKYPGLLLQKLTTKEPEDKMVEVALTAFNTVMALEKDPEKKTESFVTYTTVEKAVRELGDFIGDKTEAELIYMSLLESKTRTDLYNNKKRVSSIDRQKAKDIAKQRKKGMPLQYILGHTCFYGYDFNVDQRVLIPRFDSEHLVKTAIDQAKKFENPKILDLMTGSGAIAIATKLNVECEMTAADISKGAIEVAKQNALKHNLEDIEFIVGSLFSKLKDRKFDIILCNPPYIPTEDIKELDSEVRDYEPIIALDGGADGLDFYRDLCDKAYQYLNNKGILIMEAGIHQGEQIKEMFEKKYNIDFVYDLNNPPVARVVLAKRKD
ncbi:MAG: peptide chain release factor N(5)-glutamine methyltransferase [Bacillota bacterium]